MEIHWDFIGLHHDSIGPSFLTDCGSIAVPLGLIVAQIGLHRGSTGCSFQLNWGFIVAPFGLYFGFIVASLQLH